MSFAEIILRLGVSFVAWMMIFMHLIMVLVIRLAPCTGGDTGPWQVSLATAGLAIAAAMALPYGNGVQGMASVFRYFALPMALLVPWGIWIIWPYLGGTTFAAYEVCDVATLDSTVDPAPGWQRLWAPVQLLGLLIIGFASWRAWRQGAQPSA